MTRTPPRWSRAVAAVEQGQLVLEDLVRAALDPQRDFAVWLDTELRQTEDNEPQAVRFRRQKTYPPRLLDAVLDAARRDLGLIDGVVGVSWGAKYRGGQRAEPRSLVVWVERKRRAEDLTSLQRLPTEYTTTVHKRRYRFAVDVQPRQSMDRQSSTKPRPGVGVGVCTGAQLRGTLSALLEPVSETRGRALISGHVARREGERVVVELPGNSEVALGRVTACRDDGEVDGAVVDGLDPHWYETLASEPVHTRDLTAADGLPWLHLRLQGGERRACVDAVDALVDDMTGLVRLDGKVTRPGDSGAPCVDFRDRLVGFVVGASETKTFVIPARRVIDALDK